MLRRGLDVLYQASGVLAALFLVAIALVVLAQVGLNILDRVAVTFGFDAFGLVIPSYADFTGFFLAASSFLALAYTLRHGAHIRVNLFIQNLPWRDGDAGMRRWVELWCISVAVVFSGYFTYWMTKLMLESIQFNDVSTGMVPVPIWIPQSALVAGLAILTIALVDEFFTALRGRRPAYSENEVDDRALGAKTE